MFCLSQIQAHNFSTSGKKDAQFFPSAQDAIHDIEDGSKLLVGGKYNIKDKQVKQLLIGFLYHCWAPP